MFSLGWIVFSLGLGMRPRGPRRRAIAERSVIISGVAMVRWMEVIANEPLLMDSIRDDPPAAMAPAAIACCAREASSVKTATANVLPLP